MGMGNKRIKRIAKSLREKLDNSKSVLDIGCGDGSIRKFLGKIKYVGADIIPHGKQTGDFDYIKSTIPLRAPDKSFDSVIILFSLHHMNKHEPMLLEAKRIARKNILILEDVPKRPSHIPLMKFIDWIGSRLMDPNMPLPYTFRSDKEWRKLFSKLGMKVKSSSQVDPFSIRLMNHVLYEVKP